MVLSNNLLTDERKDRTQVRPRVSERSLILDR